MREREKARKREIERESGRENRLRAYDLEYFKARWADGWAGGWKVVAEYYNDTHSLLVNGHDAAGRMEHTEDGTLGFFFTFDKLLQPHW